MDILNKLKELEEKIELFQEESDPEEKMDLKQTIKIEIKQLKNEVNNLPEHQQVTVINSIQELEEILEY